MTLQEIDILIEALENSSCTFNNCSKLASLYTCRKYFQHSPKSLQNKDVKQKFEDIKST